MFQPSETISLGSLISNPFVIPANWLAPKFRPATGKQLAKFSKLTSLNLLSLLISQEFPFRLTYWLDFRRIKSLGNSQ